MLFSNKFYTDIKVSLSDNYKCKSKEKKHHKGSKILSSLFRYITKKILLTQRYNALIS